MKVNWPSAMKSLNFILLNPAFKFFPQVLGFKSLKDRFPDLSHLIFGLIFFAPNFFQKKYFLASFQGPAEKRFNFAAGEIDLKLFRIF